MSDKRKDSKGSNLPENVIQRPDGTYMWKKSVNGKQYCLYAKTLGEIKQKRNIALGEIEAGTYKGKRKKIKEEKALARKDMTLNEWYLNWEKAYRIGSVKKTTVQRDHSAYMKHLSDTLGREKISDIKQIDISMIFKNLSDDGISDYVIRRLNSTLKIVFESALKNHLIEENPQDGALAKKDIFAKEKKALTEEEENKFLEFIKKDCVYNKYHPLFVVGFGTGMRIGEILGLTWDDVDFEKGIINVNHTLIYDQDCENNFKARFWINSPKAKSSNREVPMTNRVKEALLQQKEWGYKSKAVIDGYKNFVFCSSTGNPYIQTNIRICIKWAVNKINRKERARAEKEGREAVIMERFSPHSMRHTFATRCCERGVSPKVAQKILGHASINMTLDIYTHVSNDMLLTDLEKLE